MRIDLPGALLVASGLFLLIFGLSQGGLYGWWAPIQSVTVVGHLVWPVTRPVSVVPLAFVLSAALLGTFVWLEVTKSRAGRDPLFEFAHLRFKTYRYGLLTGVVVAMGQLGLAFVLPIFLQDAKHLTAARNGLWQLPTGLFIIVGAQVAGLLTRRIGTTFVVRIGLVLYAIGILLIRRVVSLDITVWSLLPGMALYGCGVGFAGAQLTNVVLSEIPQESSGVASGANSTVRQVGSALGVSVIGSLLTVQTIRAATSRIRASQLAAPVKLQTIAGVHALSSGYAPPASLNARDSAIVHQAIDYGVITGTRTALAFAAVVVGLGALVSLLIPSDRPGGRRRRRRAENGSGTGAPVPAALRCSAVTDDHRPDAAPRCSAGAGRHHIGHLRCRRIVRRASPGPAARVAVRRPTDDISRTGGHGRGGAGHLPGARRGAPRSGSGRPRPAQPGVEHAGDP